MPTCLKWGERQTQKCTEYRDQGHNDCQQYQDQGYNACSNWDKNCCDWWPCSWGCKIISWVCVAWYWVSNVVCVAWFWVADVVCVAWAVVTTAVCVIWDTAVTVVGAVIETVESIVGWVLSAVAFVIELFLTIPILGRLINWILDVVLTVVWFLAGLADTVLGFFGIRPEKKLRVCSIILSDENGKPLTDENGKPLTAAWMVPKLQQAIDVLRQEANVRVIDSGPFHYSSGHGGAETATEDWVHVHEKASPASVLDRGDEVGALGEDLGTVGALLNAIANTVCFYSTWRRLVGYGGPVIIFVVRSMQAGNGRSLGPLSDYITLSAQADLDVTVLAHELGHANYLWHVGGNDNLMFASAPRGTNLNWWQVTLLRSSRHVTYF
jgi:hypothetical protein